MTWIQSVWNGISRHRTVVYPSFRVDPTRVILPDGDAVETTSFASDASYIEIRIVDQFLRDQREYWNEYRPLTIVATELIFAGKRTAFPFVVGPSILANVDQVKEGDNIRYRNTRVAGPAPYMGDDVDLFIGLFRMRTRNWAEQALGLLETVARAFDATKLSNYVSIAKPLSSGLDLFFGMEDLELRLGQRDSLSGPQAIGAVHRLAPGYFTLVRAEHQLDPNQFWLRNGRLCTGADNTSLTPFSEADHLVVSIQASAVRDDYTTFDFHRLLLSAIDKIWESKIEESQAQIIEAIRAIRQSPDLISPDKNRLMTAYVADYKAERTRKDSLEQGISFEDTVRAAVDGLSQSRNVWERAPLSTTILPSFDATKALTVDMLRTSKADGPVTLTERSIADAFARPEFRVKGLLSADSGSLGTLLETDLRLM